MAGRLFFVTFVSLLGVASSTECDNIDYQVVVYRYSGTSCGADETVAYYQSGSTIRESSTDYKTYTCCDDMKTVTVTESYGTTSTVNVEEDQCLHNGTIGNTGSSGTSGEESFKFECVANPTEAAITVTVYGPTATDCDASEIPIIRLPAYEGCNEDFKYIMDLECDGTDVVVTYSPNNIDECYFLQYESESFTLSPGCNLPEAGAPFFGSFYSPVEMSSTCGAGLSGGAVAAIVIIVLLLLGSAGFAYYWFKIRPQKQSQGVDFEEFNEYTQLDGDTMDTDLL